MPAQVADWPAVKATAIHCGSLKEAAKSHDVEYDAVRQRAKREEWPVGRRVHKLARQAQEAADAQIIRASSGTVTSVTSAAQAAINTLAERQNETKMGLSGYVARMAKQGSSSGVLEEAPLYKAVADIAGKVWPEQAKQEDRPLVNINLVGVPLPAVERNVTDVEPA